MRVLIINVCCGKLSTGTIASNIANQYLNDGHECIVAYGASYRDTGIKAVKIGTDFDLYFHAALTRIFDNHGFGSVNATRRFLRWADEYNPDVLWLHNIHGYYINIELLFNWIKSRPQMKVKWTLHDCWAFTGHCTYFSYVGCDKWKTGCSDCPQKSSYPASILLDRSKQNYERKKKLFTGVKDMTLITPSKWLAELVKESYLSEYPVEVHYNTINTDIFKPTPSDFRSRHGLDDKFIILGVASTWEKRKGLDDFIKLSSMLDERFSIVLVGLSEKQLSAIPENIIGISRTDSPEELAAIYTAADVFVNTTYEDNYPTVNLEARACGTPVITYNSGGSPESAGADAVIVDSGDIPSIITAVNNLYSRGCHESTLYN